jgi:hypothetical protein
LKEKKNGYARHRHFYLKYLTPTIFNKTKEKRDLRMSLHSGEGSNPTPCTFVSKIAEGGQFLEKGVIRYNEIFASIFFSS